ncbi:MAG TPA: VCBS repeat-containing protein, partial [Chryseolinea sp.]|nr:VCBS repeat-containing protein [Chryseolinea sp.]
DLVVVGEYMPVKVFINEKGQFTDRTAESGLEKTNGWWNRIKAADIDLDGDLDFVVGNHGLNSRFRASPTKPVCLYVSDFDQNGSVEQIVCNYIGDKSYPMVLRHDLVTQLPALKKKYLKYESYKDQTIEDVFTPEQIQHAAKLEVYQLATSVFINDGKGRLTIRALPMEAQVSPVYGIDVNDINGDGNPDLLFGGNLYRVKPEAGRYDASFGCALAGDGKGGFKALSPTASGFKVDGEVRDILMLSGQTADIYLVTRNNNSLVTFIRQKLTP